MQIEKLDIVRYFGKTLQILTKIAQIAKNRYFPKKSDFLKLPKISKYNDSNNKITGTKNLSNNCKNKIGLIIFFFSNTELEHFEKTEIPPKSPSG